jgi:hypothetical protein
VTGCRFQAFWPAGFERDEVPNSACRAFLVAFAFDSVPAAASLLREIETLRVANRPEKFVLPANAPIGFVPQRWASYVLRDGKIDHRYYELCVLAELRGRLLAGDVWARLFNAVRRSRPSLSCNTNELK